MFEHFVILALGVFIRNRPGTVGIVPGPYHLQIPSIRVCPFATETELPPKRAHKLNVPT